MQIFDDYAISLCPLRPRTSPPRPQRRRNCRSSCRSRGRELVRRELDLRGDTARLADGASFDG